MLSIVQIYDVCTSSGPIVSERRTTEWHIGQELVGPVRLRHESQPVIYHHKVGTVIEIQADGAELDLIVKSELLPYVPNKKVVRWFGETAQFIVANLGV